MNNNFCKNLLFLCSVFTFYSCQQSEQHLSVTKIEADITSDAELELSGYFENFRMLKLPSDTVMGEIKRIRYENDNIYISDGNTLFVFSNSGELLSCFNKTGGGPDEYTVINDFTVNGDSIRILCRSLRKLLTYNHSGECLSTHNLGFWAQAISPVANHSYFLYCGNEYGDNERHKLRRIRYEQEDSMYLAIDKNQSKYLNIRSEHNFYRDRENIYFLEAFNDTIYESVGGGRITPLFYVDYKGKNIPASFFERSYTDIADFFQEFNKTSYAYGVLNFAMYERFLMFGSYYLQEMKLTLFDRKSQMTKTFSKVKDDIYFNGLTIPVSEFLFHADRHLFIPIDAHAIVKWRDTYLPMKQFEGIINTTKEEDNPLLLIFDCKH